MTGLEVAVMNDPWWIVLIKVVGVVILLLTWTIFNVWWERRLVAWMQSRIGPIMNPIFLRGLGQALGDGLKALFKEDFAPKMVDRVLFTIAPLLTGVMAFTAWSVIPLGGEVTMFGVPTRLQVTDLDIGVLVVLATASVGIYGFVLAGWSSQSSYSLMGSLRSAAQMISYELAMGLSFVSVFLYSRTMSTWELVAQQRDPLLDSLAGLGFTHWHWLPMLPAFVIYLIAMVGETNRLPFDLPECESELVSGHLTEYSGFRYAIFFLAEYINMATVSGVATTLFLGGYNAPWPITLLTDVAPWLDGGWMGLVWFILKVQLLISFFVWLRGSLPRFRYDQFMDLGWKWLIPLSLVWIVVMSSIQRLEMLNRLAPWASLVMSIAFGAVLVALLFMGADDEADERIAKAEAFDPFEGGFPVPPMPGQELAETSTTVSGSVVSEDEER